MSRILSHSFAFIVPLREADDIKDVEAASCAGGACMKWQVHSAQTRSKLKAPNDWNPLTPTSSVIGNLPARVGELMNVGLIHADKEAQRLAMLKRNPRPYSSEKVKHGLFADLSQSVQRRPFGNVSTLHTNSLVYSYEHDLVLPALSHPLLHGYPHCLKWDIFGDSRSQAAAARHLIGESWSLPVGAQVLTAALLTPQAPWWRQGS